MHPGVILPGMPLLASGESRPLRTDLLRPLPVLALVTGLLFVSAWLHDDAYISFRTIDNFLNGHGLTWNPGERVQVYTHPLWLLLSSGLVALTGEFYATSLALAVTLSLLGFVWIIFRVAPNPTVGCAAVLILALSKSYLDFATSGLEDPLTRLLLVGFVMLRLHSGRRDSEDRVLGLSLVAALATLNRPDAFLLFLPTLVLLTARDIRHRLGSLALGLSPIALWGLFALIYYGSPLPNTAYAKLGMGVPRPGLIVQGLVYLGDALVFDPLTPVVISGAAVLILRRPQRLASPLLAGGLLYLGYVVWIGGDYMRGRFLAAPLLASLLALLCYDWPLPSRRRLQQGIALFLVLLGWRFSIALLPTERWISPFGIGDEQRIYHPSTGLIFALGSELWPDHPWRAKGERARTAPPDEVPVAMGIGLFGFYAGPDVHIVDWPALSDPLRARLPGVVSATYIRPGTEPWRPGHTYRPLPEGYLESLRTGTNRLTDPDLADYYDVIRRLTRGEIWNTQRLLDAVKLNLGFYQSKVDAYVARHPDLFTTRPAPPISSTLDQVE